MATVVLFDSSEIVEDLKKEGVSPRHAKAIVHAMLRTQELAAADTVKAAREAGEQTVKELDGKTADALLKLGHELALVRKDMETLEQNLSAKITLLHWMLAVLVGGVGTLIVRSFTG